MRKLYLFFFLFFLICLFVSCKRKAGRGQLPNQTNNNVENVRQRDSGSDTQLSESDIRTDCICNVVNCDYCVKVVAISDGDTFRGRTSNNARITFRIYGIDAPEQGQAFGNRSKKYLSELIYDKMVGITLKSKDRWGRDIVLVYTSEGQDVSEMMLLNGMAWHYKTFDDSPVYDNAEKEARSNERGLWSDNNPIPPWDFRD